jgi:hypothetical protein
MAFYIRRPRAAQAFIDSSKSSDRTTPRSLLERTAGGMLGTKVQRECFKHYDLRGNPRSIMFAIPNGGLRDKKTAAILQLDGVKAGVPDVYAHAHGYPGIWLEFKGPKEPLNEDQELMFPRMLNLGERIAVVRDLNEALRLLEDHGILLGRA